MLKIKHSHRPHLPHFETRFQVAFAPVSLDDDELTAAIDNDPLDSDNNWQLNERPDTNELEAFWSEVQKDVANDPNWFTFSED